MIYVADQLLNASELNQLRALFDNQPARDGRESTAQGLQMVKHNQEIVLGENTGLVKDLLASACNRAPVLNVALLPRKLSTPILSRYSTLR